MRQYVRDRRKGCLVCPLAFEMLGGSVQLKFTLGSKPSFRLKYVIFSILFQTYPQKHRPPPLPFSIQNGILGLYTMLNHKGNHTLPTKTAENHTLWGDTCQNSLSERKIAIISPGVIFIQKAFLMGLFSGELIFAGAYCWRVYYVSEWVRLDNRNSLT